MRVVFFGTPLFAAEVLDFLITKNIHIVAVISKPDKPKGRAKILTAVPIKKIAEKYQIPFFQPEKVSDPTFYPTLEQFKADLFVVVAYGEILKQSVLNIPSFACINLHASLLPKFRGAAPIQQALIQGEVESGITIMHMVREMDAGDIIKQVKISLPLEMNYATLEKNLCEIGKEALYHVITHFKTEDLKRITQNKQEVTFAPKIELEDCQISWDKKALEIHNLVRGVDPEPGAFCFITTEGIKKRLKVFKTALSNLELPLKQLLYTNQKLYIGCQDSALELITVQLEGKKRMAATDFYRGVKSIQF